MLIRVCISKRISNTRNVFDILKAVLTFICLQKCPTSPNIKTWELTISAECLLRFGNHNQKIIAVSELRCTITKFPNEPLLENYRQKKDKFGIATFVSSKFPSNHFCKVLVLDPLALVRWTLLENYILEEKSITLDAQINIVDCDFQILGKVYI